MLQDSLINILEDYISEKRNGNFIDRTKFERRLKKLRKTDEQIHEIMLEFEDDCDKELLAGSGIKKAKKLLIFSVLIGLSLATLTILFALGFFFEGKVTIIFYGGIAAAFFISLKSYNEIRDVYYRKKRREFKWGNW